MGGRGTSFGAGWQQSSERAVVFVGRLFTAIATPNVFTRTRQTRRERKAFSSEEDEKWPRRPDFFKADKSAAPLCWVGFSGLAG